ncbi:hypothetical protein L5515_005584 [Caenorhabditis briggsae]|uniref:Uncharacterized protein n=1 Tax=Caenorhabditis briggsae TaxID=6238 RepID=A0AAE9ER16_CAEBR|nr:hypothetical protein L5515_005584 [Caenorhabditis briggsae]
MNHPKNEAKTFTNKLAEYQQHQGDDREDVSRRQEGAEQIQKLEKFTLWNTANMVNIKPTQNQTQKHMHCSLRSSLLPLNLPQCISSE